MQLLSLLNILQDTVTQACRTTVLSPGRGSICYRELLVYDKHLPDNMWQLMVTTIVSSIPTSKQCSTVAMLQPLSDDQCGTPHEAATHLICDIKYMGHVRLGCTGA